MSEFVLGKWLEISHPHKQRVPEDAASWYMRRGGHVDVRTAKGRVLYRVEPIYAFVGGDDVVTHYRLRKPRTNYRLRKLRAS